MPTGSLPTGSFPTGSLPTGRFLTGSPCSFSSVAGSCLTVNKIAELVNFAKIRQAVVGAQTVGCLQQVHVPQPPVAAGQSLGVAPQPLQGPFRRRVPDRQETGLPQAQQVGNKLLARSFQPVRTTVGDAFIESRLEGDSIIEQEIQGITYLFQWGWRKTR